MRRKRPKRSRLWLGDGSCIRLRPQHRNHVWAYDFVADQTHDGRPIRMLKVVDEFTRECLAIRAERQLQSKHVIEILGELFLLHGVPDHIHSDNGPVFTAASVRQWLDQTNVKTLFIEPGSSWENGYVESFNGRLRDQCLNGEIFETLPEAQVLIERWRHEYNRLRPHGALGYRPPAAEASSNGYRRSEKAAARGERNGIEASDSRLVAGGHAVRSRTYVRRR